RLDPRRARRIVNAAGTAGRTVTVLARRDTGAGGSLQTGAYLRSVLDSIGYHARLRLVPDVRRYYSVLNSGHGYQIARNGWADDYPSAYAYFHPLFTCTAFPLPAGAADPGGFCPPRIDRAIARA